MNGGSPRRSSDESDSPADAARERLDAALARLPRAYRDVIVVCDLEGHTHEEAARVLAWPVGTVKGRLHRAREKLRVGLMSRGVVGFRPGGPASLGAPGGGGGGGVPALLVESTVRAAVGIAAGTTSATLAAGLVPSAGAVGLAEGVLHTMFWKPIAATGAALLTCGAVATSGVMLAASPLAGQDKVLEARQARTVAKPEVPPVADPKSMPNLIEAIQTASDRLAKARQAQAEAAFEDILARLGPAGVTEKEAYAASLRIVHAEVRSTDNVHYQFSPHSLAAHQARMKRLNERIRELTGPLVGGIDEHGWQMVPPRSEWKPEGRNLSPFQADYYAIQADLWLAESRMMRPEPAGLADAIRSLPPVAEAASPAQDVDPTTRGADLRAGLLSTLPEMPPGPPPILLPPDPRFEQKQPTEAPAPRSAYDERTQAILAALDAPCSLQFPESAAIGDVLQFIARATESPGLPDGLPLYLDPSGLVELRRRQGPAASGTETDDSAPALSSLRARTVSLNLAQVPLRTGLRLALKQAGLGYIVKDGVVYVGVLGSASFEDEVSRGDQRVEGYGELQAPKLQAPDLKY
jgi:hypothetical protein